MKQCKVCGTLVHIDSNTCPSCGNHSFFVLDVKICPLCGKVNGIANSFCEQCGKPFVTAQGGAYIKRPTPVKRPDMANYPKVFNHQQPPMPPKQRPAHHNVSAVANSTAANMQELSAKHAYKDFVALKPDVVEGDDYSEVSYYVKGEGDKLPVIILPKFAKTSGKNIIVNIVVESKQQQQQQPTLAAQTPEVLQSVSAAEAPKAAPVADAPQPAASSAAEPVVAAVPAVSTAVEEFKPFSAIAQDDMPAITPKAQPYDDSIPKSAAKRQAKDAAKRQAKDAAKKSAKGGKRGGRVAVGIIALILALGAIVGFAFPFYSVESAGILATGISAVMYQLGEWGVVVDISFLDLSAHQGYGAYVAAAATNGDFANLASYVPYAFAALAVAMLVVVVISIISIFTNKKAVKVLLVLFSGFAGLATAAIALSMKFVFNTGLVKTLSLGLIITAACLLVYFLFVLIFMRTNKKEKLSSI